MNVRFMFKVFFHQRRIKNGKSNCKFDKTNEKIIILAFLECILIKEAAPVF